MVKKCSVGEKWVRQEIFKIFIKKIQTSFKVYALKDALKAINFNQT